MKLFKAIIWSEDPNIPGQRVIIYADGLEEAKRELESKYGEGRVFDLHSQEDAEKIR